MMRSVEGIPPLEIKMATLEERPEPYRKGPTSKSDSPLAAYFGEGHLTPTRITWLAQNPDDHVQWSIDRAHLKTCGHCNGFIAMKQMSLKLEARADVEKPVIHPEEFDLGPPDYRERCDIALMLACKKLTERKQRDPDISACHARQLNSGTWIADVYRVTGMTVEEPDGYKVERDELERRIVIEDAEVQAQLAYEHGHSPTEPVSP